nr:hypothetical protein Iba_scaffold30145CG0030 [Ipomoea batatas]GMD11586.1 hypothetical protein Iba_chr06fCG5140 [Ipomoea batatas]
MSLTLSPNRSVPMTFLLTFPRYPLNSFTLLLVVALVLLHRWHAGRLQRKGRQPGSENCICIPY